MALADLLISTVDIYSPVVTKDRSGGASKVPTLATSAVACLIQPAKASRVLAHAQLGQILTHTVYFDADPGVMVASELHPVGTTRVLFCIGPSRDQAGQGECWAVDCEERT